MTANTATALDVSAATLPAPVSISRATAADAAVVSDLFARTIVADVTTLSREFGRMVSSQNTRKTVEAALNDPDAVVMLARSGGRAVGFAIAVKGKNETKLEVIGVMPDMRAQGIGTSLFRNMVSAVPGLRVRTAMAQSFFSRMTGREGRDVTGVSFEIFNQGFFGPGMRVQEFGARGQRLG